MILADGITVVVEQPTPPRFVAPPPTTTRTVLVPMRGPAGPSGSADAVTHVQSTPAATWTIPHGLGRVPSVVTVWIGGDLVDTDTHADATHVVLTFAAPTAGEAHIL